MSIQIYQNQKYQRARLGTPLAFAMFIVSVWGAYLYNVWLGGALSLLSLWLIAQSIKFKEEVIEAEEVEEPIRQDQQHIPLKQPLRSIPQSQANMFEGWQPPRIGLGLNI
jgi:heme exporter protein D